MDFLSLPDEMCASVLKYCKLNTLVKCRRLSNRIDRITKKYDLNRVDVEKMSINLSKLFCAKKEFCPLMHQLIRRLEDTLEPLSDKVDYNICTLKVYLKKDKRHLVHYDWPIFQIYVNDQDPYEALDNILRRIRSVEQLYIVSGNYDVELDKCLYRNRKIFEFTTICEMYTNVHVKCASEDFNLLKICKNLESISINPYKTTPGFCLEKVFSEASCGIVFPREYESERRPESFGDDQLRKWIERTPGNCNLEYYENNFTLPVFKTLLLKLVNPKLTKKWYNFGILPGGEEAVADMQSFLTQNNVCHIVYRNDREYKFEILCDEGTPILFTIEGNE